jgi:3-deoxy-D-arabino-heptulosonate 7-phosphate (DAHP) synthase
MASNEPILKSHRRPDVQTTVVAVRSVRFGDGSYPVIAGPVAVESEEQILAVGEAVATGGGSVLRARAFVGNFSPYAYKGLGTEALWLLEHAGKRWGLPTATRFSRSSNSMLPWSMSTSSRSVRTTCRTSCCSAPREHRGSP